MEVTMLIYQKIFCPFFAMWTKKTVKWRGELRLMRLLFSCEDSALNILVKLSNHSSVH